jgi:hypothetical protein
VAVMTTAAAILMTRLTLMTILLLLSVRGR